MGHALLVQAEAARAEMFLNGKEVPSLRFPIGMEPPSLPLTRAHVESRQASREQKLDAFDHKRLMRGIRAKQDDLGADSKGKFRLDPHGTFRG